MKTKILVLLSLFAAISSVRAITIAQWTFESPNIPPDLNNSTTSPISGVAAEIGSGTASGVHASTASDWSTPVGNGSANSLSVNTWAVNDYFQFQLSTVGFFDIFVSFDQTSSGAGPKDFKLAYSTDGSVFTDVQSYIVLNGSAAWNSGSAVSASQYSFDLGAIAAIESAAAVYFRLIDKSTTSAGGITTSNPSGLVATTGTDRVDNFTVNGTPITTHVPDTGTTAVLLSIPLLGLFTLRRLTIRPV